MDALFKHFPQQNFSTSVEEGGVGKDSMDAQEKSSSPPERFLCPITTGKFLWNQERADTA